LGGPSPQKVGDPKNIKISDRDLIANISGREQDIVAWPPY